MIISEKKVKTIKAAIITFLIIVPMVFSISEYMRNENLIDHYENELRELTLESQIPVTFPYTSSIINLLDSLNMNYDLMVQSYTLEGEEIREKTIYVMPQSH